MYLIVFNNIDFPVGGGPCLPDGLTHPEEAMAHLLDPEAVIGMPADQEAEQDVVTGN